MADQHTTDRGAADGAESKPVSRRALLKTVGVAAVAGAGIAAGAPAAAAATAGPEANPPLLGESSNARQAGVTGDNTAAGGVGIFGTASSSSGTALGVQGWTSSGSGAGVAGTNKATSGAGAGVVGTATLPDGSGVLGGNKATTGEAVGVTGVTFSPDGYGVYGQNDTTGDGAGVWGKSASTGTGNTIFGESAATEGNPVAVLGTTEAPSGVGVGGSNHDETGVGAGVLGVAYSPTSNGGVYGVNHATTGNALGVHGTTASTVGVGVQGEALTTESSATAKGVWGKANGENSIGVAATNSSTTGAAYGLVAAVPNANTAGFGVVCNGNFGASGTKSAVVPYPDGTRRALYCVESPESFFEDFGRTELEAGRANVEIANDFLPTVLTDDYFVFLTPEGDCHGLYVSERSERGFTVRELQGGHADLSFSYRIVAKRKDVKAPRLAEVEWPEIEF